ncbi:MULTISPECIES: LysR family transcriptional regulator [unclassified Variovorax]|uniref:LysR family transcriptional regulator n=1 Tax=unclassified Variovorax TaxID=663243 RepID=UPI00076D95F6|nr:MULTISPECIES: LysR family transcriptional regulator [unclassified Variovorax]KWT96929.1 Transcriptional regulator, LysR family [Variovorax sp. WDL1]PNG58484.1 HTH-type transcriptional regulator YofA [Variovorax sp. B4]PNG61726.1 HTH-type transcriptional regulator YofA [Variovorax sp. B2]VTV12221.1 HTH-type transcriptional regulator YofA [Variovorax sp. WDL1]
MEWSDIKIFLAVARHGTLGAAARQAGVSQPTMGRRLKALEASMSASLFQRTPEGFVLTAAGEAALAHAEQMEEEALAFERDVAGESRQLEGLLRVSTSDWFGVHMLSPVLAQFMRRHPGVQVELLTDARLLNLSRREADLVLRIHPFDEPDVLQRKLMHVPYALYGAAGGAAPQAGDGAGATLLTMDTAFRGFPDALWLRRMLPNARIAFGSNSREAQAAMCAEGLGLAVLPMPLAARIPQLQSIDLGEPPPGRDVWLGYHRDMRQSARLRALIDHMTSAFG